MKKLTTILLIFILNTTAYSHEDYFVAYEYSNLHIKVQVGYKSSLQLKVIAAYAPVINDFIREINPDEKVFIQFKEDYCYFNTTYAFLTYGDFKNFLVPGGFPFAYKYDMSFIYRGHGLSIVVSDKYFRVKPLLQLIEFGLENSDFVKENQTSIADFTYPISETISEDNAENFRNLWPNIRFKVLSEEIMSKILRSELTEKQHNYLSKPIRIKDFSRIFDENNLVACLQNDSIHVYYKDDVKVATIPSIDFVEQEKNRNSIFLFDTNKSFYYIDKNRKLDNTRYLLTYDVDCLHHVLITYQPENKRYILGKTYYIIFPDDEYEDYNYFYPVESKVIK